MDAFVYISGVVGVSLDEIEEALDDAFEGKAEVTGSGAGKEGCSFDLEIVDTTIVPSIAIECIEEALASYGLNGRVKIVLGDQCYYL